MSGGKRTNRHPWDLLVGGLLAAVLMVGPPALADEDDAAERSKTERTRLTREAKYAQEAKKSKASEAPVGATRLIVQGTSLKAAKEAVADVGGRMTHELGIIKAVGAELDQSQRESLEKHEDVRRIYEDRLAPTSARAPSMLPATKRAKTEDSSGS